MKATVAPSIKFATNSFVTGRPPIEHPRSSPQRYYSTTVDRDEQMVSPGLALSRDASGLSRASLRPFIMRRPSQHRYLRLRERHSARPLSNTPRCAFGCATARW